MSELHVPPTPERGQHSRIELVPEAIPDEAGRPSQPYRSIDLLAALARPRRDKPAAITPEMRAAGEQLRSDFRVAALDTLRAADVSRPPGGHQTPGGPGYHVLAARERVYEAFKAVGGTGSDACSICWHVLGMERSLKEWGERCAWRISGRPVNQHEARGILITTLGVLAAHYEL